MAVTITLFDHTAQRFADGSNAVGDTYKLALYTNATGVDFSETTKAQVDATASEVANGNGYTTGGATLANVAVSITDNDAAFDADDASWTASGGSIEAAFGLIYNDTDTDDPPVAWIDFDGTQTAGDGTDFNVNWNASGIITFTVT